MKVTKEMIINRIALLEERHRENQNIIAKLKRQLRALENKEGR